MPDKTEHKDQPQNIEVHVDASRALDEISRAKEPKIDVAAERDKIRRDEVSRIAEINSIAKRHNQAELADEYIKEGRSASDFVLRASRVRALAPVRPKSPGRCFPTPSCRTRAAVPTAAHRDSWWKAPLH